MLPLLHQNLGGNEIFSRRFVVVEDDVLVDGQFLIHHFVSLFLMKKVKVVLVSFSNNYIHYERIQTRVVSSGFFLSDSNLLLKNMGLSKFGKSGLFQFWNGNSLLFSDKEEIKSQLYYSTAPDFFKKSKKETPKFVKDVGELEDIFEAECSLLLIDDIAPLRTFLGEEECMRFLMELSNKVNRCVFVLSHKSNSEKFNNFLEYLSGLYIKMLPLKSGLSKEITGMLEYKFSNTKDVKKLKYKESEFSVTIIPS